MKDFLKKFFYSFIWLMVVIFVLDIVTKWSVVNYFGKDAISAEAGIRGKADMIEIIKDFIYIGGSLNTGAAWSLGATASGGSNPILIVISVVLSGGLIFYYIKSHKKNSTWMNVSLALMIAGAVGNLIDRAFYRVSITGFNGVVDWIQFIFGDYYFPMFNIADSSLVIGVVIIVIIFIVETIKDAIKKGKEGEYKYSPEELEEKKNNENNNSK